MRQHLHYVTFCVLVGIVIFRSRERQVEITNQNPNAIYTKDDVNRMVNEALAKQQESPKPPVETAAEKSPTSNRKSQKPNDLRRQLSLQRAGVHFHAPSVNNWQPTCACFQRTMMSLFICSEIELIRNNV